MRGPSNEEIIADMVSIYHELGYLTAYMYTVHGHYHSRTAEARFGNWKNACQVANIPLLRSTKKLVPMVTTTCLSCDEWFDRPKDDPSCRRCKACRNGLQDKNAVPEGWEQIAC